MRIQESRCFEEHIWIMVLAAGASSRMGTPKSLLQINGDTMLRTIVRKAMQAGSVGVVLRRGDEATLKQIMDLPVETLYPAKDYSEMSDSLKTAIEFCQKKKAGAAVILLGDQPDLQLEVIEQLISVSKNTKKPVVQANYLDGPGHPVLFKKNFFSELLSVTGDQGARDLLKSKPELIERVAVQKMRPVDLDTPEDYFRYLNKKG